MDITTELKKYLYDNEKVVFSGGPFKINEEPNFMGFVTDKRILFLRRTGLIFKQDRTHEVHIKHLVGINLMTEGMVFKKMLLKIKTSAGEWKIFGSRGQLEKFHKEINRQLSILESPIQVAESKPTVVIQPREQKQYVCKICETSYPNKNAALICEKSHKKPKRIIKKKKMVAKKKVRKNKRI